MLKVRKLTENKEVDTEFWLKECSEGILLKVKLNNQEKEYTVALINKNGIFIYDDIDRNLGFKTIKRSSSGACINVYDRHTS